MKKANELSNGDIIKVETYSSMYHCMVKATAVVMDITFFGENASVMVRVKEGFEETINNVFATPAKLFQLA